MRAATLFLERNFVYVIFMAAGAAIDTLDITIKRIREGIEGLHQFKKVKT